MMMQNDFVPCKLLRNTFKIAMTSFLVEPRKIVTGSYYLDEIKPLLNKELQLHNLHSPATFSNFTTVRI